MYSKWHYISATYTITGTKLVPRGKCNRIAVMIKHINDTRYKALIDWLKTARLEQGLSVRELGHLLDEPHQFVVKVETCERKLNVFEYVQYCEVLKLDCSKGLFLLKTAVESKITA